MQALYAHELGGGPPEHLVEARLRSEIDDGATLEFAEQLFRATVDATDELDTIIQKHTDNWELGRIAPVDRCLLRMATCELLNFEEIPPKVSINEAIEVAKKFSTPKSSNFINGVLDAVLMDLQREGRLQKSGRGLVGMDSIRDRANSS